MRILYIIIIISVIFGCKTEEKIIPDTKPIHINSLPVGNVSYNEATLNAEIGYLNDEKILEYGFIIYDTYTRVENKINLGTTPKVGLIQWKYKPQAVFELGKDYAYSFYLKTEVNLYKSEEIRFNVKDFWVDQSNRIPITLGDTLRLTGNFKQLDNSYDVIAEVNFSPVFLNVLHQDDKSIHIKIPENLAKHNANLNLYLQRRSAFYVKESLINIKILGKVDFKVEGSKYLYDMLDLESYGLEWYDNDFIILVGNSKIPYRDKQVKLTELGLVGTEHRLGYYNGVDTVISSKKLKLKVPAIHDFEFEKTKVHPNEFIFVGLKDFIPYFGDWDNNLPIVTFGQTKSPQVYLYSAESFRIKTPDLPDGEYDVVLNSPIYGKFKHPQKFKVEKLKFSIENKNPLYMNDEVIFKGNFRDNINYAAKIGEMELHIGPASKGQFKFKLEKASFGVKNIQVGFIDKDWYPVFEDDGARVEIAGIRIDEIYPKNALAGDIITLKGKGLKSQYSTIFITVGDVLARVIATTDNEVKFYMPINPRKGKLPVAVGYNHFDGIVYAKDFIENL